METERLYRIDQYAVSNESIIHSIINKDGYDVICVDKSVFFPEGGGQPSDTGTISRGNEVFEITHVFDNDLYEDVFHITDAPFGTFHIGDEVTLTIDWDKRFSNMQRHLGEHMLSGTLHTLYGGINKGFHMGEEYITIDIDLGGRLLTEDEIDLAEIKVNEAIWENLPVTTSWFDNYKDSLVMPVRKTTPHDGKVSVVTVGEKDSPYDCIACCGTHPSYSAEVGLLSVYKVEPNKGMNRIYFDCGINALKKLKENKYLLDNISKRYSCSPQDLSGRLNSINDEISQIKQSNATLTNYVNNAELKKILNELECNKTRIYSCNIDIISVDELLKLGFSVIESVKDKLLILVHDKTKTALLFSSCELKCGLLVKEYASSFNGRGGGKDDNARAVFTTSKDLTGFISKIKELNGGD